MEERGKKWDPYRGKRRKKKGPIGKGVFQLLVREYYQS